MKEFYNTAVKVSLGILIIATIVSLFGFEEVNYSMLRHSAAIGTYLLFLMMGVKSVYFIMKRKEYTNNALYKILRKNNMYQREQGLIVFNIIFIHIIMTTLMFMTDLDSLIYYYASAIVPTLILIYMEITSFKPIQKIIKRWKQHHTLVWIVVPLIYLHVLILSSASFKYLVLGSIILLIALLERVVGLKKGTKHLRYLMIGFIITFSQLVITETVAKYQASGNENYVQMETSELESSVQLETNSSTEAIQVESEKEEEQSTVTEIEETNKIYEDGTYTGTGNGHRGTIEVQVVIEDDQILSVDVLSENEDDKWWQPVINTLPDAIVTANGVEGVDGIAGSTHSSDGLLEAVSDCLEQAKISN